MVEHEYIHNGKSGKEFVSALLVFAEPGFYKMQVDIALTKPVLVVEVGSSGRIKIGGSTQLFTDLEGPIAGVFYFSIVKVEFGGYFQAERDAYVIANSLQALAIEACNVGFAGIEALAKQLPHGLVIGCFLPVEFNLPEDGRFPIAPFHRPDVADGFPAFVAGYGNDHVLKTITGLQYTVPIDPSMPDVLYIIAKDKTVNNMDKLELPYVWKEVGLHDRYFHSVNNSELGIVF